jgi:hypothetical protein
VKRVKLEEMTINELAERFAKIGIAQDQAELMGEIGKLLSADGCDRERTPQAGPRSTAGITTSL